MSSDWEPNEIPRRRFEFKTDASYKFWSIELADYRVQVRYGRIGSRGQMRYFEFDTHEQARESYDKRVDEKLRSRYVEVKKKPRREVSADQFRLQRIEHEPFLQAILETPDDPGAYHIYADWLVENDDPLGKLIQVQLALEDPLLEMRDEPQLRIREAELLSKHGREWLGDLKSGLRRASLETGMRAYEFWRGLLSKLHIVRYTRKLGEAIRCSPHCRLLRELRIDFLGEGDESTTATEYSISLTPLRSAPFDNLREFALGSRSSMMFVDQQLQLPLILSRMPRLERLTLLNLMMFDLRPLAQMELPGLMSFTLASRSLTRDIERLAKSNWMSQLSYLYLDGEIEDEHIHCLVASGALSNLELLTLGRASQLTSAGWRTLREANVAGHIDESAFP